ncbi:MAG TPA: hypothetical protein VFG73_02515 [Rhodanobacteraceae bacterium]|nr:hypothetical protein [Rhodanobacteraceae bacterium]
MLTSLFGGRHLRERLRLAEARLDAQHDVIRDLQLRLKVQEAATRDMGRWVGTRNASPPDARSGVAQPFLDINPTVSDRLTAIEKHLGGYVEYQRGSMATWAFKLVPRAPAAKRRSRAK